ncbi:cytochrome P450 [Mucor mucedo]|uniref:cytochrome P450 n=1 Tax=Mucor mucedo TaxID=29922 RepID=UPI00221EE4C8|nr:cytochrome P450 [Mucor mucedo]KAI7873258.1 cytochrome P450 [Mucor mucedo]
MEKVNSFINSVPQRFEREKTTILSIAAATVLLYTTYKIVNKSSKKKLGLKEIPSPGFSFPYVGHMFSLGSSPGRRIAQWHKEVGHIFKLNMGIQTWILIDDPLLAHKVFVTHGVGSSDRPHSTFAYEYYSYKGKGVGFCPATKQWKVARGAVQNIIAPKVVDAHYLESIKTEAIALAERFIKYSRLENGVDPTKHLHLNSMNLIFKVGFGKVFSSVEDPDFISISAMIKKTASLAGMTHDLPNFLPIFTVVDYCTGARATMKNFIEKERDPIYNRLIKEALESDGTNFVKALQEFDFDEENQLVLMSDLINGGSDTVSVTLGWIFAIMCNYPLAQKKAADEIDAFVIRYKRHPKFADRDELPYCVSMLKECMRFRPTTPFAIPHSARNDFVVDGYLIPKGATLVTSMESMHQNPEVYAEPLRFYPERFLNNLKTMDAAAKGKSEGRDHFNFGWGRRMCPGIYMAEVELFTTFIHVILRCIIEPVRDMDGKEYVPNIENAVLSGLTSLPAPHKLNFVERIQSLGK